MWGPPMGPGKFAPCLLVGFPPRGVLKTTPASCVLLGTDLDLPNSGGCRGVEQVHVPAQELHVLKHCMVPVPCPKTSLREQMLQKRRATGERIKEASRARNACFRTAPLPEDLPERTRSLPPEPAERPRNRNTDESTELLEAAASQAGPSQRCAHVRFVGESAWPVLFGSVGLFGIPAKLHPAAKGAERELRNS